MVQSDELWWEEAWASGLSIGEPSFDDSTRVLSIELAERIERAGEPLGVVKAVVGVTLFQNLADRFSDAAREVDVLIARPDTELLADTSSDHATGFILTPGTTLRSLLGEDVADAIAGAESGFVITGDAAVGFARSAARNEGLPVGEEWTVVVSQPASAAFAAVDGLDGVRNDLRRSTLIAIVLVLVAIVGAAVVAFFAARAIANSIVGPVVALGEHASRVADTDLPALIDAASRVERASDLPRLPPVEVEADDEVAELAETFNRLQATAGDLAARQVLLRRHDVADAFIALGRRNQSLVSLQIEQLEALERSETDPDLLAELFRLDHAATRMRRNAESLLVLAGEEAPRRAGADVPIVDLVRAATGEVDQYTRVDIHSLDPGSVHGSVAPDLTHLLAELIENTLAFSPPTRG